MKMSLKSKLIGVYLKIYFYFKKKILFKDKYGLTYYLYKNTRPNSTFNHGVRSDDTTVLYTIEKILSYSNLIEKKLIHCIDVGGYIGVVTLMMSNVLQRSNTSWKIHTFEPFTDSFERLKENVSLDPCKNNIILNKVAVSEKEGISALTTYKDSPGLNHLEVYKSVHLKNHNSQFNTKVITLSNYIKKNNINHINICKIDTEGSDYSVIKGLNGFLKKRIVDYFIFEYDKLSFEKISLIFNLNGYLIYYMVRNENILLKSLKSYPKNSKALLNLIAVSPEKKHDFLKIFKIG
jgi:FkbM family methyltransferase